MKERVTIITLLTIALLLLTGIEAMGQKTTPTPPDPRIHPNTGPDTSPSPITTTTRPPVVVGRPVPPARGRFRISLNGFTCIRPTSDGPDDINFKTYLRMITGDDLTTHDEEWGMSPAYGNPSHVPTTVAGGGIERGGSASNGGFRAGDSFPTATPWLRSTAFQPENAAGTRWRSPMRIWEGELVEGANGLLMLPSVWRAYYRQGVDTPYVRAIGDTFNELTPALRENILHRQGLTYALEMRVRDEFGHVTVADGNSGDRPIGMYRTGDHYTFLPYAMLLDDRSRKGGRGDRGYLHGRCGARRRHLPTLFSNRALALRCEACRRV